jgi:hypothetical protein
MKRTHETHHERIADVYNRVLGREFHRYAVDVLWGLLVGALLAVLFVWGADVAHGQEMPILQMEHFLVFVSK